MIKQCFSAVAAFLNTFGNVFHIKIMFRNNDFICSPRLTTMRYHRVTSHYFDNECTNMRSRVSRIRSIDSKTVLIAVSKPIVKSVPGISLSIVPGIPTAETTFCQSHCAVIRTVPPITTKPSIPNFFNCSIPFNCPSSVANSG